MKSIYSSALIGILKDSKRNKPELKHKGKRKGRTFLEEFRLLKKGVIIPVMEHFGKQLAAHGHSFAINAGMNNTMSSSFASMSADAVEMRVSPKGGRNRREGRVISFDAVPEHHFNIPNGRPRSVILACFGNYGRALNIKRVDRRYIERFVFSALAEVFDNTECYVHFLA